MHISRIQRLYDRHSLCRPGELYPNGSYTDQNKPTHIAFYCSLYLKIVVMSAEQSLEGFKAQCLIFLSAVSR